jgi:hypothetical protein
MNSPKNIRIVAYSVVGVLVVVLIIILAYAYYPSSKGEGSAQVQHIKVGGVSSTEASNPFNVDVLSEKAYQKLNRSLLDAKKLPVSVPENRGKANLFGI